MPTFIFGHRNPDADSVCASIALSYLMNEDGANTVPKVLSHIDKQTRYILDFFKVKEPDYLNDTKVKIKDIKYNKKAYINENESIFNTFNFMQKQNITALPLVDDNKELKGFITLKEIAKYLIGGNKNYVDTTYEHILESINGIGLLEFDSDIKGNVMVASYQAKTLQEEIKLTSDDILIVGDRYKVLEYAINSKIKLIVLTGNHELPSKLLKKAQANKVNVILSKDTSLETVNKVILSNQIKSINPNLKPVTINHKAYRTDFISMATKEGYANYPVVNSKNECLGLIKVTDTDAYLKQQVIMVDHNSLSQSAVGIEEAEIVEIIDHHNLSGLGISVPINFRSRPVGSTCTIIYSMFQEKNIDIPYEIGGLMLSAILSDTLVLKSPTTTEEDIIVANKLAKLTKIDINDFGYELIRVASSIKGLTVNEVVNQDFKSYSVGNHVLGIAQIMTMDFNEIEPKMEEYVAKLNELQMGNFMCVVLFITDVYKNGSYVIYNTNSEDIIKDAFDLKEIKEGLYIPNLVSRKIQMLPALLEVMEKKV